MKLKYMAALVALLVVLGAGGASAKSLYVIEDINAPGNIPIAAYDIQTSQIVKQTTSYIPDRDGGAVGITIDTDSAYLFVTFEFSGTLDIVNGTTMVREGQVTAPGASNLAGIVVDQDEQRVYAVDRHTNHLYVYEWDAASQTLTLNGSTYKSLTGASAIGIALDETNDLLYVASQSQTIRYYDTATWTEQGNFTVTPLAMGIAVDVSNGYVYTGGWSGSTLSQYNLNTDTENTVDLGTGAYPIGFAVDPATGNFFVTTYAEDHLRMMDSSLNVLDETGDIGNPTGVCVPGRDISYNPLGFDKDDGLTTAVAGSQLIYNMSYTNTNPTNITNGTITDALPGGVSFVSATGNYTNFVVGNTVIVTWNIGNLTVGQSGSVTLTVNESSGEERTLTNPATIDSDQTPPTTQSDDTEIVTSNNTTQRAYVVSSDVGGTEKNVFDLDENVYCYAGNLPANDPAVDIYVVPDQSWSVGDSIGADVSGGVETVATDGAGLIGVTEIWTQPLTVGDYDIIVDVDQDGVLDANEAVDGMTLQGFEAIPEFPTIAIPIVAIIGLAFLLQRRKEK
ncbi:PEF-CTERM sorting domain-containing protein [Methanococcoides sp. NM1]|uniref:PEF-CTERM sorting domain-containing protein n=1 Tax=Methanococcoides sp. NM1 TaxID=1201013 RepID=UPI0010836234|nr:PEF-CTERM sorting domain-containing protein [Methanococcoides sp. NM1]